MILCQMNRNFEWKIMKFYYRQYLDLEINFIKLTEQLENERKKSIEKQTKIDKLESLLCYYKKECSELRNELLKKNFEAEHLSVTTKIS